jgi:hypothetical protein
METAASPGLSLTGAAVACLVGIQFDVRTIVALLTSNMMAMTVVGE